MNRTMDKTRTKRMRLSIAACALLVLLLSMNAFAATSTAIVRLGVTSVVTGPSQSLATTPLKGTVASSATSTGTDNMRLTGTQYTKGAVFTLKRDSVSVSPGKGPVNMYWANPMYETGTHYVTAHAPSGNHYGNATTYQ